MPVIRIREEKFPKSGPALEMARSFSSQRDGGEDFTLFEIAHAALTAGHHFAFFQQRPTEAALACYFVWKLSAVMMAITVRTSAEGSTGRIYQILDRYVPTERLEAMDPSERNGASYHLGLALSVAWGRRRLGIPWFQHLDVYGVELQAKLKRSKSRPDLIGQHPDGRWAVLECKGRRSSPSTQDKKDALRQARRVISVAGVPPAWHVAFFAFFGSDTRDSLRRTMFQGLAIDPPGDPDDPKALKLDEIQGDDFLRRYYEPWRLLFTEKQRLISRDDFIWAKSPDAGLEIAIEPTLWDLIHSGAYERIPSFLSSFNDSGMKMTERFGYWAGDGLVFKLSPDWQTRPPSNQP